MIYRLTFSEPVNVTNPGMDGVQWSFPFSIIDTSYIGTPEQAQKTSEHRIIVPISRSCLATWRLSDHDAVKVLFEFGLRFLRNALTYPSRLSVFSIRHPMITTATHENVCPFDAGRIPEPEGYVFECELPKRSIGFHQ